MRTTILCILLALVVGACESREADPDVGPNAEQDTVQTGDQNTAQNQDPSAAPPAGSSTSAACISSDDELTGSGVGAIHIGTPAEELLEACPAAVESTVTDVEGHPQRVVDVPTGGGTVRAEIVDGEVWRIAVEDTAWRTSDGLGVGSTISELLELPNVRGMMGEGNLVVVSPRHCGLSFQVDRSGVEPPSGGDWDAEALERLPDGTTVSLVRIFGCGDHP